MTPPVPNGLDGLRSASKSPRGTNAVKSPASLFSPSFGPSKEELSEERSMRQGLQSSIKEAPRIMEAAPQPLQRSEELSQLPRHVLPRFRRPTGSEPVALQSKSRTPSGFMGGFPLDEASGFFDWPLQTPDNPRCSSHRPCDAHCNGLRCCGEVWQDLPRDASKLNYAM